MRAIDRAEVLALLTILLLACRGSRSEDAALVSGIGASRLASEAAGLQVQHGDTDARTELPRSLWPSGFQQLEPQAVRVSRKGVFIQRGKRFVEEEGIFIAFPGAAIDAGAGSDPSFTLIEPRIYSYRIKG